MAFRIKMDFSLHQTINPWMGIGLISLMCFWVVLYFFVHKTDAFTNNYLDNNGSALQKYTVQDSTVAN